MAKAMLNYGKYAKAYFGGEVLEATAEMNNVTADTLAEYKMSESGELPEGVIYYGSSLLLESETVAVYAWNDAGNKWFDCADAGDGGELFIIKNGIETPQGDTVIVNGDHGLSVIDESGAETVIDDSQAYSLNTDAEGKKIIVDENSNEVSVDESGLITYTDKNGSKVVKDLSQEQESTETSLAEAKTESATLETARSAVEGRRKGSIAAVVCTAAIAVISAAFIAAVKIKRRKK